jgi:hypothetical protein
MRLRRELEEQGFEPASIGYQGGSYLGVRF